MNFRVSTNIEPCTLRIKVKTFVKCTLRLIVYDENQVNTVFTNRFKTFDGNGELYVRMPLAPKVAVVTIFNQATGNRPKDQESDFEVVEIKKMGLERRLDVADISNPKIRSFVEFAQRFCYNAGVLPVNRMYRSDDGQFEMNYLPVIINSRTGLEYPTPARISKHTGIIDINQKRIVPLTVPGRMAVICHEFAHLHMNKNMYNEKEADLNGLLIYLGLGFPRIEACEVFLKTFYTAATDANLDRYKSIERFINEFEKINFVMN